MTLSGSYIIIAFILSAIAPSFSQDVKLSPAQAIGSAGQPFYWNCELINTNLVPSQIRWLYNNQYVISEGRKQVMTNGTLAWTSVRKDDEGAYQCEVRVDSQLYKSKEAGFRLAYLATSFTTSPSPQTRRVGESVVMSCAIYSLPPPTFTWFFNGLPLSSNLFTQINDLQSELRIMSVTYNRAGRYTCRALNTVAGAVKVSEPATLTVQGPPQWISDPTDLRVRADELAILHCLTMADPAPRIAWTRVDLETPITGQEPEYTIFQNGSLRIDNSQQSQQGRYKCEVENGFGKISQTATLLVAPATLRFISTPNDTDVIEGRSVTFQCIASPNAVVTWSKVGGALTVGRMQQSQDGRLTILNVMTSDSGTYTCTAVSGSETISHSVRLSVRVGPWFSTIPNDVVLPLGNNLLLNCSVRGDPMPTVYWILPSGESITANKPSSRIRVQGNSLSISSVTTNDAGKYTCVAVNLVATASVTVTVNVAYGPVFTRMPEDTAVIEGGQVLLHCNASGFPLPVIDWITPRPGLGTQLLNNSLLLTNVQSTFSGVYKCQVTSGSNELTAAATVSIQVKPKLASFPTMRAVQAGDNVVLNCVFTGVPPPTFRWTRRDNQPLVLDVNMVIWENNSLEITNIRENQFGEYSCIASNKAGDAQIKYTVYAKNLPTFVIRPSNTTGNVSMKLEIACNATGAETPSVKWYKLNSNTQPLPITSSRARVHVNYHGTLLFTNVEAGDEGWYQCVASNSQGNVTAPVYVKIQGKPAVSIFPTSLIILEGRPFQLVCQSNGSPVNLWRWRSPVSEVNAQKISIQDNSLIMSETSADVRQHYGPWLCLSCSVVGCNNATINVTVQGKPIVLDVQGTEDTATNTIMVHCLARGYPTPQVIYSLGNRAISAVNPLPGHSIVDDALYIKKEVYQLTSNYSCSIQNSFGTSSQNLERPTSPTNVKVEASNTSVTVNWDKVSTLPGPVTYSIQYEEVPNASTNLILSRIRRQAPKPTHQLANASGPPYTIQGLNPYSKYQLSMTANNALGKSPPSTPVTVNTKQGRPTAPLDLKASYGGGRVSVSWQPPARLNAPPENIRYQTVYHDVTRNSPLMTRLVENNPPFMEYLDNIPYGIDVQITVAAINSNLNLLGDPATTFLPINELSPRYIPRITKAVLQNDTSVYVQWQYPGDRSKITGFLVRYQADGTKKETVEQLPSASASLYVITNVAKGSTYNISVAAYNSGGIGIFSAAARVRIVPGDPNTGATTSSSLSLGEVIAIIIGCFAFLFLLLLLIFLCCYAGMQKRRQKREKEVESIYSNTKRRVMYNSVGRSDSHKDLGPVLYDANSDNSSIYNSEARVDPELLLVAKELYSPSEDSRVNTPTYSKHQSSTLPRSGHVYAEVRKPGHLKVSEIPDIPVDGPDDWVKRVSPQDLNEQPRVIGGRRSRGSSDSHGYNSQSESDGLPWVEPHMTARSDDAASTVRLSRAWHPIYDHQSSHGSKSRSSRKIAFQDHGDFDPGSPGSARPMIHGEMFMRPSSIDRDNGITNPLYQRRDSSAALF